MYTHIIGKIVELDPFSLVIECNGIGYGIIISTNTYNNIKDKSEIKILTSLQVREDSFTLYGFYNKEELQMFKLLIGVSKIGPKVAMGVLSKTTPNQLKKAILLEDESTLSKAPGIGKKTAQRMILELKDKVKKEDTILESADDIILTEPTNDSEVVSALLSLGYSMNEIKKVVDKLNLKEISVEESIKLALKEIGR